MKTIAKIGNEIFNLIKTDRDYNFFSNGKDLVVKASVRTGKIAGKGEYVECVNVLEENDATRDSLMSIGISPIEISILLGEVEASEYNSTLEKCINTLKLEEESLVEAVGKIYDFEKSFKDSARITNMPDFSEKNDDYLSLIPEELHVVNIAGGISVKDSTERKVFSIWNIREKKGVMLCTLSLNQVVLNDCIAPSELEIFDFKGKFPFFNNVTFSQVEKLLKMNNIIK